MKELKKYLEKEWRYNNHNKYRKYFKEWFENLTDAQVKQYTCYMKGEKLVAY